MTKRNSKSDVKAKQAYKTHLENSGYVNVEIIRNPCDIKAEKDGMTFYFEIKMTKQSTTYFGAATMTEWIQALKTPDLFKFVIAKTDERENEFSFTEYSPIDFMSHSTIPPFKIFFNVNLNGKTKKRTRKKAIQLTDETMTLLTELHDKIRQ
jgi:hypothetical protein